LIPAAAVRLAPGTESLLIGFYLTIDTGGKVRRLIGHAFYFIFSFFQALFMRSDMEKF